MLSNASGRTSPAVYSTINQIPTSTCPLRAMNVSNTKYVGVGLRIAIKPPSQLPSTTDRR